MRQIKESRAPRRVSADAIAAMLASDNWKPESAAGRKARKTRGQKISKVSGGTEKRKVFDRESAEALPPGHPVSWSALWGADLVPAFPELLPMGSKNKEDIH